MKRRLGLVSNSSSSSYVIRKGAKELPVWPIFLLAAIEHPDVDVDVRLGTVEDLDDNATYRLCDSLGISVGSILKQTSHM